MGEEKRVEGRAHATFQGHRAQSARLRGATSALSPFPEGTFRTKTDVALEVVV